MVFQPARCISAGSLMPQPVSGVSSRSMRARRALAQRLAQRLLPLSWRLTRQPANSFTCASAASRAASSLGMSAGSFWPSPSRVAIQGARACLTPVRTAVLWPLWFTWCSTRSSGVVAFSPCSTARVSSRE
ncbi:hypothetical protein G6F64_014741 [Rhizopus arrhizus]|uniref:Uncharacterized protein n=1 Tax=Rhizopus oryzae TaxID=64495 RepID=A0A9P6WSV1_RHIOR|nr:hypothetical protein G6F64_014741 [Rhizopus arrhizus]